MSPQSEILQENNKYIEKKKKNFSRNRRILLLIEKHPLLLYTLSIPKETPKRKSETKEIKGSRRDEPREIEERGMKRKSKKKIRDKEKKTQVK